MNINNKYINDIININLINTDLIELMQYKEILEYNDFLI